MGHGPPLLMASGLTSEHKNPTGRWRAMAEKYAAPFAEHFTVYLANRRPGLAAGVTMADMAADYAAVIEEDLGEPAYVHGTSTGGSLALQLAIGHPDLVRRMVVSAAAFRSVTRADACKPTCCGSPGRRRIGVSGPSSWGRWRRPHCVIRPAASAGSQEACSPPTTRPTRSRS